MTQLLQQLFNGLTLGATYGLVALGYTMVYGIVELINFAHGEVFMIGAFCGLTAYQLLPEAWAAQPEIALPVALLGAALGATITAVVMERLAYRPLRGANRLTPLITAIGVSIALQEATRLWYPGAKAQLAFPRILPTTTVHVGGITLSWISIFVIAAAVVGMTGLQLFVRRTRTGRAMRATSQDRDTARLMGIDTDKIIVITFALGGVLAGLGGVLHGMRFAQIDASIGFLAGLKAFTAAVLGGIGNITGAVLGGFLLGVVETLATQYVPGGSAYKDVWAFVVLIGVLTLRPSGLLGESRATRA